MLHLALSILTGLAIAVTTFTVLYCAALNQPDSTVGEAYAAAAWIGSGLAFVGGIVAYNVVGSFWG